MTELGVNFYPVYFDIPICLCELQKKCHIFDNFNELSPHSFQGEVVGAKRNSCFPCKYFFFRVLLDDPTGAVHNNRGQATNRQTRSKWIRPGWKTWTDEFSNLDSREIESCSLDIRCMEDKDATVIEVLLVPPSVDPGCHGLFDRGYGF